MRTQKNSQGMRSQPGQGTRTNRLKQFHINPQKSTKGIEHILTLPARMDDAIKTGNHTDICNIAHEANGIAQAAANYAKAKDAKETTGKEKKDTLDDIKVATVVAEEAASAVNRARAALMKNTQQQPQEQTECYDALSPAEQEREDDKIAGMIDTAASGNWRTQRMQARDAKRFI